MIEFYKDGDAMAIRTDMASDAEFLDGCAKVLAQMIEQGLYKEDWEFHLGFWLPQIVDICCAQRGYKAEVVSKTVISAGNSHFVTGTAAAALDDRKQVQISALQTVLQGELDEAVTRSKAGK